MSMWVFAQKISRVLMRGVVLCIPVQLGFHFWPSWALLLGRRIDYLSPILYFTDCLIVGAIFFLCIAFLSRKNQIGHNFLAKHKQTLALITFAIALAAINISTALVWQVSLYRWIKIALFAFVVFYIATHPSEKKHYIRLLVIGGIFSAVIALVQFGLQHSIGGIFWLVGERLFTIDTPVIARGHVCVPNSESCQLFLRSYASFAHPNVLAGYLSVILFLCVSQQTMVVEKIANKYKHVLMRGILIVLGLGLLVTMSRTAIIVSVFLFFWWYIFSSKKKKRVLFIYGAGLLSVAIIMCIVFVLPFRMTDESVVVRQKLIAFSDMLIAKHWFFGVGLGNFISALAKESTLRFTTGLQPVHNMYLLALTELGGVGVLGVTVVLMSIWKSMQKKMKTLRFDTAVYGAALLAMCTLGLFDHYMWSLQQGQLLMAVLIGLYLSTVYSSNIVDL